MRKKIFTKKRASVIFAVATAMPFFAVIATNLPFTVKDIVETFAADKINTDIGIAGYVTAKNKRYYDATNKNVYSMPYENATGQTFNTVTINLTKETTKSVVATYHLENYTAIKDQDFEVPTKKTVTIPAGSKSADVTINILNPDTFKVTSSKDKEFYVTKCFKFVLDSLEDTSGNKYNIYDGDNNRNGFRRESGILYKNSILCSIGGKYFYNTVASPLEGLEKSNIRTFDDYYDPLSQFYGSGVGDKTKNTYDLGGNKDDGDSCRPTSRDGGGAVIVPEKYHSYYYEQADDFYGISEKTYSPYRDWYARLVETGVANQYGSFTIDYFNGSRDNNAGKSMQMILGDYQFLCDAHDFNGDTEYEDMVKTHGGKADHCNWNIDLNMNRLSGSSTWKAQTKAIIKVQEYIENYLAKGTSGIPDEYVDYVAGIGVFNIDKNPAADLYKTNIRIKYDNVPKGVEGDTIPWFKLPVATNENEFGFTIDQTHKRIFDTGKKHFNGYTYFSVLDDTTPVMVKDAEIELGSLQIDGKIKITVTYSEPVQCFEHTYFRGSLGNDAHGDEIVLVFRPTPGQLPGCSAICYEADTSGFDDFMTTSLLIKDNMKSDPVPTGEGVIKEEYTIRDFAQNGGNEILKNETSGHLVHKAFDVNINRKHPDVSFQSDGVNKAAAKLISAKIKLDNFTGGKIYYSFVKDDGENNMFAPTFSDRVINETEMYCGYKDIDDTSDGSLVTLDMPSLPGRNGNFYCFVKVVSRFDQVSTFPETIDNTTKITSGYGPYVVDNDSPVIYVTPASGDNFTSMSRRFDFVVKENAGIDKLDVSVKLKNRDDEPHHYDVQLSKQMSGDYTGSFTLSLEKLRNDWYTITETGAEMFDPPLEYEDVLVNFSAIDRAGNSSTDYFYNNEPTMGAMSFPFSKYPILPGTMAIDKDPLLADIPNLNLYPIGTTFTFTSSLQDDYAGMLETSVTKLPSKLDKVFRENYDDSGISGIKISQNSQENHSEVTLSQPGYYEIVVRSKDGNYSDSFDYYISDELSEDTPNYLNATSPTLIPKMKVYQLNETSKQYYMDGDNSFHAQAYNGTNEPVFSDKSRAKAYIFTHEFEDLQLLQVTSSNISDFNNVGGSTIKRASTETREATIGQWWVRYKDSRWTISNQTSSTWGYYYYCDNIGAGKTPTITEDQVHNNSTLWDEMDRVAGVLADNGQTIYLVDTNHIDQKTGAPKLTQKQIEISRGSIITKTFAGNDVNSISCAPDNELYNNTVAIRINGDVKDYPLATNLPLTITDSTTLYVSSLEANNFRKISCEDGTLLKEAINISGEAQSGVYRILEIDNMGAKMFDVYVDKESPYVSIDRTVYDPIGDETKTVTGIVSNESTSNYYSQTFTINGMSLEYAKEVDSEAYVAVFQKGKLVTFRYLSTFQTPIVLEDGIYDVTIGDRSGNTYSFRVFVSDEPILVSFKPAPSGSKITISTTNREDSEILRFDVYCNGELISQDLTSSKQFTIGGSYYAVIQDQYGNLLVTDSYLFTKKMPEIELYYIDGINSIKYKDGDSHILESIGDDSITLYTCSLLKIKYDSTTTGISIVGYDDSFYTQDDEHGTLTITQACSFSFRVYYKGNENEYILYNVIYDGQVPTISADYNATTYELLDENSDYLDIETQTPNSLDYKAAYDFVNESAATESKYVVYGSSFAADCVHFTVSDNTKVSDVIVTRDGAPIEITLASQGYDGFEFFIDGMPGQYEVKAYDVFGQVTTLRFTIIDETFTDASIDGESTLPLGPLGTDGQKIAYGHDDFSINISNNSTVLVTYDGEEGRETFALDISSTGVVIGEFSVYYAEDDSGADVLTFDNFANPKQILSSTYYPIDGVDLLITINKDGSVNITYVAEDGVSTIEVRVCKSEAFYNLYRVEFSKENPSIDAFMDNGDAIAPVNGYVYCSTEAKIENPDEDITSILVAYNSESDDFSNARYVAYTENYVFKQGFYHFIVTNKYGNSTEYTAVISDTITGYVTETYLEKDSQTYSIQYQDYYYSNNQIIVTGYNVKSLTEASGAGVISGDADKATLTLSNPGIYVVTFVDANNNKATITVEIGTQEIEYDESWLIGYNENALLKDQGYTNQKLSFGLETQDLASEGITQIYVVYNGEKDVIYGYVGEDQLIGYSKDYLAGYIGSKGDGVYFVYFSNKYGDVCEKVIHYQVAPTLVIERTTNMSVLPETISVKDALANGIWSNENIKFSSELNQSQYQFFVKSGETAQYQAQPINYLFELSNASSGGEVYYFVEYIDAYGNIYEFKVNLLRRNVSFNMNNITTVDYQGTTYTKANFKFDFDDSDVSVEYKFNGSENYLAYAPNEIVFKDGVYEFHMFDKAGNQAVFVVVKDSYVTFEVRVEGQSGTVYYGQAINASSVVISSNSEEGLEYASIKLNGQLINDDDFRLTKAGHYEIIMKDKIGNIRYFHFYLISNELATFEYDVPEDYVVTSAYYINTLGIKVTCLDKINDDHIDLTDAAPGTYEFQIKNIYDNSVTTFTVVIDKSVPTAELVGCSDGDVTTKAIELSNLQKGDIVTVYKDGEIIEVVQVSGTETMSKITEGGSYRIVVENRAGVTTEFNFEKLTIANGALSALIIIGLLGVAGGFFAVLVLRGRSKNDE